MMAPYGGPCEEDYDEPTTKLIGCGTAMTKAEISNVQTESATRLVQDRGISSVYGVHELLECPVCTSLMYPPIYQPPKQIAGISVPLVDGVDVFWCGYECSYGHTLCSGCKTRVRNQCPTCWHHLGDIRCLALEKVAQSLELPCRYKDSGCPEILRYYNQPSHEKSCGFRPYNCPYAGYECSVTGDIPMLVSHLKEHHKVDMHDGCIFNHRYVKSNPHEVESATWILTIFNCFGRCFCLHFEAFQLGLTPVYMAFLRFMGEDDEAKKFSYSLEVGGNGRKLIWQGIPRSIRDGHRKVRDSQDGLIIQRNLALYFSGGDKQVLKLRVAGHIWKEE